MTVLNVKTRSGANVKVALDPSLRVNQYALKVEPQDQIDIKSEQEELVKKLRSKRVANNLVVELEHEGAFAELTFENYFESCSAASGNVCASIVSVRQTHLAPSPPLKQHAEFYFRSGHAIIFIKQPPVAQRAV